MIEVCEVMIVFGRYVFKIYRRSIQDYYVLTGCMSRCLFLICVLVV